MILVRLVRFEEKCVAGLDLDFAAVVPHDAAPGDDVIELPLCAVGMVGAQWEPGGTRAISTSKGCRSSISVDFGFRPSASEIFFSSRKNFLFGEPCGCHPISAELILRISIRSVQS
jgi:hypothetical protein